MTNPTDLAARFEAKREEAWNKYIRTGYVGRSDVAAFNAGWNAARDMARADAAGEAGARWLPIETAPKDGTVFLAYAEAGQHDLPALFSLCAWHPDAGFCICELREPTHWQSLPPPPAQQGSSSPLSQGETVGELAQQVCLDMLDDHHGRQTPIGMDAASFGCGARAGWDAAASEFLKRISASLATGQADG